MAVTKLTDNGCELCNSRGGDLLWEDDSCRVVLVQERDYPGFCRVILKQHVKEMTDLSTQQRQQLMRTVFAVESALRELLSPDKVNLASLGNAVPHLHWHVIPRWHDDAHFPGSVWSPRLRHSASHAAPDSRVLAARLRELLG